MQRDDRNLGTLRDKSPALQSTIDEVLFGLGATIADRTMTPSD